MPEYGQSPLPHDLQFEHAEPLSPATAPALSGKSCVACKQPIANTYYHAQGQVVCPSCAERIQSGQQAAPALSLARAALYGAGAALAGCLLYAAVTITTGLNIGLIAIVVGYMVGKAIRQGSNGLGGRPQQILAVTLTYFAITTSYIPAYIYHIAKRPPSVAQSGQTPGQGVAGAGTAPAGAASGNPRPTLGRVPLRPAAAGGGGAVSIAGIGILRHYLAVHHLYRSAASLEADRQNRDSDNGPLRIAGAGHSMTCSACNSEIPEPALSCPQCRRLTHAVKLEELAQRARAAWRVGRFNDERELWGESLALLPEDTVQYRASGPAPKNSTASRKVCKRPAAAGKRLRWASVRRCW